MKMRQAKAIFNYLILGHLKWYLFLVGLSTLVVPKTLLIVEPPHHYPLAIYHPSSTTDGRANYDWASSIKDASFYSTKNKILQANEFLVSTIPPKTVGLVFWAVMIVWLAIAYISRG